MKEKTPLKEESGVELMQTVVAMLLGQSVLQRLPRKDLVRFILGNWLVFGFVMITAYRGSLIASLTLPKYPPRPETIEDLVNTIDR